MSGLTKNQRAVLNCLTETGKALTAYDILDRVRDAGIRAPVQVYRALERLMSDGAVHRIESMNAYIACAHDHADDRRGRAGQVGRKGVGEAGKTVATGNVVFAVCDGCGAVLEIPLKASDAMLGELVERRGFVMDHAVLEIRGQCAVCRLEKELMDA